MFEVSRSAGPVGFTAARSTKPSGLANLTNLADLTKFAGLSWRSNRTGLSRRSNPEILTVLATLSGLAGLSNLSGLADWNGLAARGRPLGRSRRTLRSPAALESFADGGLSPRPGRGVRRTYLARAMYSRVSVLIVMVSPSWTKCGTCTVSPVSIVAGLSVLVTAADRIPGSVCTTLRLTVLGSETLSGV